jgi:hypothetical protein
MAKKDDRSEFEKGYTDNKLGRDKYSSSSDARSGGGFFSSKKDDDARRQYNEGWDSSKKDKGEK